MNEIDYLQQQIASMQRRLSELQSKQRSYNLVAPTEQYDFTIEADGGTSCKPSNSSSKAKSHPCESA